MTALSLLAETSERLAATSKRGEKQRILAAALLACEETDRGLAALYLAGSVRQPKLFVGYAQLPRLRDLPGAAESSLSLRALDQALQDIADVRGAGSAARR